MKPMIDAFRKSWSNQTNWLILSAAGRCEARLPKNEFRGNQAFVIFIRRATGRFNRLSSSCAGSRKRWKNNTWNTEKRFNWRKHLL